MDKNKTASRTNRLVRDKMPVSQKVIWQASGEDKTTGMIVESEEGVEFISWEDLKPELLNNLLTQLGRVLGNRPYTIEMNEFHGRKNWVINILDEKKNDVGSVWLGGDPYRGWKWDGNVRVGKAKDEDSVVVWQIFERYSDGSYRRLEALDRPEDRLPD